MKLQPAVKKETAHIALGVAVGVAVMLAVFALWGALTTRWPWGAFWAARWRCSTFCFWA